MMKFSAVFLAVLLTGCTLTPKTLAPVSIYDLGPVAAVTVAGSSGLSQTIIQVIDVSAPVWLDTQSIHYRLAYHDPARIYAYSGSRWTAPPAKLLTERFRQYFASHTINWKKGDKNKENHAPANYLLKIELGEFTQVFHAQNDSQVVIRLRASLYEPNARLPIAQRSFTGERPTQTADAAGAVAAFILVSDNLLDELVQWLTSAHS
ncbi:ABC-type transport auxiliary lipoprotein family protein [Nitrosomonas sp.]|uniref:ABC-type transport auxiliary lipoprotein family protein n=1 Tax=Nitrosomonas sp. TaxID=42353 RepID=UPI0033065C1D